MYLSTEQARSNVFEGWGGGGADLSKKWQEDKQKKKNKNKNRNKTKTTITKTLKKTSAILKILMEVGRGGGVHEPLTIFTVTVMLISLFLFVP